MGQPQTIQENGKTYIDIPGIGRYEVGPADDRSEAFDAPKLDRGPNEARLRGFLAGAGEALTPEVMAGASSLVAGPEMLAVPPLVAAGTSMVRDYLHGDTDPTSLAGGAAMHGAVNAVPGVVGSLVKRGGGTARNLIGAATGSVGERLRSVLGLVGPETNAASTAAQTGIDTMLMPSGARVASIVGLKEIEQKMLELAKRGKTIGDPQFDALRALYQQGHAARQARMATAPSLMATARMGITNAAQRASTATQQTAQSVTNALRALLAGGSEIDTSTSKPQRQPYQ